MGLYTLVASKYDRANNHYLNEVQINLEGGPTDKLMQIDAYTASSSRLDLLAELREKGLITNQDTLSIRYIKNKNEKAIYFQTIYDNPKFRTSFNSLTKRNYYINGHLEVADALRYDNEYFKEEWTKIKQLIDSENFAEIKRLYPKENHLKDLISGYLKSSYDNDLEKERELEEIKKEFSRYKTFRGWVVTTSKNNFKFKSYSTKLKIQEVKKIKEPISIEAAEEEYEKRIENNTGINYNQYLADSYNRSYLDDDQEEFLEEDEMEQVHGKIK